MALIDGLEFHDGCDDGYCSRCMKASNKLGDIIEGELGKQYDRMGQYHSWLKKQGIMPETDGGWWSREALEESNVNNFITAHKSRD